MLLSSLDYTQIKYVIFDHVLQLPVPRLLRIPDHRGADESPQWSCSQRYWNDQVLTG